MSDRQLPDRQLPGRQLTGREIAALSFRILGVVILLGGVAQGLMVLLTVAQGEWYLWSLLGLLMSLIFVGAVALPLIFHSEALVRRLFPRSDGTLALGVSRRDLLTIGLALVGAWFVASNLPYLARLAAEVLWQAEGSRRAELGPGFLSTAAFEALGSVLAALLGGLLFRYAGGVADWWERRSAGRG